MGRSLPPTPQRRKRLLMTTPPSTDKTTPCCTRLPSPYRLYTINFHTSAMPRIRQQIALCAMAGDRLAD
eukprot:2904364-Pleurochrysis_carterae.AAC.1